MMVKTVNITSVSQQSTNSREGAASPGDEAQQEAAAAGPPASHPPPCAPSRCLPRPMSLRWWEGEARGPGAPRGHSGRAGLTRALCPPLLQLLSKYDPQKEAELRSWIEGLTGLSIGPDFQKGLKDGVILCT